MQGQKVRGMPVSVECGNCGNAYASLEPIWGSHHGRFRVSVYQCSGHGSTKGCGRLGVEMYDEEDDATYLYGCLDSSGAVEISRG